MPATPPQPPAEPTVKSAPAPAQPIVTSAPTQTVVRERRFGRRSRVVTQDTGPVRERRLFRRFRG
jgi:hypothetical protein